jgi:hypothetical protein
MRTHAANPGIKAMSASILCAKRPNRAHDNRQTTNRRLKSNETTEKRSPGGVAYWHSDPGDDVERIRRRRAYKFEGPKANTGMATHSIENGQSVLRVTSDFKVPDTPAPTWRVVDSTGNIYTLDAFKTKGGEKREVFVPRYVPNIAKVQVYCAWAQVLLGEASFSPPVLSGAEAISQR